VRFATCLHPETGQTSRRVTAADFVGHSYPHYAQVAQQLAPKLSHLPSLPLRTVGFDEFRRVHAPEYLDAIARMAAGQPVLEHPKLSLECAGYQYCLPGYGYGLGGLYEAIDQMKRGSLDRAFVFTLGGHHAHHNWGHGYCLLNPMAAAVRYAQEQGFEHVLIVDWDIHHGDGTQAIFAHDPKVHQISLHSGMDLYMMKASKLSAGSVEGGRADGHCNIPVVHEVFDDAFARKAGLTSGFYRSHNCLARFEQALNELPFTPQLIFILAGADGHIEDCGKDITNWTCADFKSLTRLVLAAAQRANCPVLSVQGGGYNLPVTVATTVAHVEVLADTTVGVLTKPAYPPCTGDM
jgi:acetoin utilization deacetylase AcuC-like enzyme